MHKYENDIKSDLIKRMCKDARRTEIFLDTNRTAGFCEHDNQPFTSVKER
jgi:hypothetical protein